MALDNSHFMRMCYLSSLGFDVVGGTIISGAMPPIEYEFEPKHGVHCKQVQDGEIHHRFILFSDLFGCQVKTQKAIEPTAHFGQRAKPCGDCDEHDGKFYCTMNCSS